MSTIPLNQTEAKPALLGRGFPAVCIKCGDADAIVRVNLADVTEFRCDSCEAEYTADDVREFLHGWTRVLAWLEQADAIA
jgi:hypothetical protein